MEDRANVLRGMRICRFCLSNDEDDLTNIYEKNQRDPRGSVPLPLQVMACVAIEVFQNDGMPQLICSTCRDYTNQAYIFKTNCKKADDALKIFLATGQLSKPYMKPYPPQKKVELSFNLVEKNAAPPKEIAVQTKEIEPPQPVAITPKRFKIIRKANAIGEAVSKRVKMEDGSEVITLDFTNVEEDEDEPIVRQGQHADEEILGMDTNLLEDAITVEDDGEYVHNVDDENGAQSAEGTVATSVFPCNQCERSFALKQLLDLHVVNHQRERSFECSLCEKRFFTKYDLMKHHQTHMGHKPFDCAVCNKSFARETLLRRHEKIHNDVSKYMCIQCDRSYLTKVDLDVHMEKHRKKRAFTCMKCDKSFVFKQGLERHLTTHTTEKPYKCNYCEASFSSPIKLTRHITSHAGLRPYPCKLCGRTFLLSHHLTRHMRSHYASQSKNIEESLGLHKCDICSMSFRRKDSLINHSAIHSMVNLRCVICNTVFETAKMVKEHITTHLTGLPFPCERCDYSFESSEQLEEHELKHAEMEYEDQIEKEVVAEVKKQGGTTLNDSDEEEYEEAATFGVPESNISQVELQEEEEQQQLRQQQQQQQTPSVEFTNFLKDEITSDIDEEPSVVQDEEPQETIKPIVRSEGTKVYQRKTMERKVPNIAAMDPRTVPTAPLEQITQLNPTPLLIDSNTLSQLRTKQLVDLKGAKVQRLIISKEEMKQMAKKGLISVKNGMVRAKGGGSQSIMNAVTLKRVPKNDLEGLIAARPRQQVKQYQRTPMRFTNVPEGAPEPRSAVIDIN